MSTTPNVNQRAFRIRTDTAAASATPTWAAAENVSVSLPVETTFRIRFSCNNTGTASSTSPTILRVSKNAGAYTAVTTSTGATLGAQSADASSDADGADLGAYVLSAGSGTPGVINNCYDENGSVANLVPFGQYEEFEYGLILKTAGAAVGDTFDFRLYNNTTAFTTYSQTPRITCIAEASGTNFQPKTAAVIAYADYNSAGHTTSSATVATAQNAGDLVVVFYAVDNASTTDLDEGACESITDSAGNIYIKGKEWTKSGGNVQNGVTAGIWYCQLIYALTTSTTITATWNSATNRDGVAMGAKSFTVAANKVVTVEATATGTSTAVVGVPSLNPTTANIECLRFRVNGAETNASQDFAIARHTFGWAGFGDNAASSGTAATSIVVGAESRISTGTGDASSPRDQAVAVDQAGVYVAFKARDLATGTDFDEKDTKSSLYRDWNTLGHTTSVITVTGPAAIGDLVVVTFAVDNAGTTSGGDVDIPLTSITDNRSNTYSKAYTAAYTPGGFARDGAQVGIYYSVVTTALALGDSITLNWDAGGNNRQSIAALAKVFTVAGGKTVAVEAVNYSTGNASTPPSLDATTASIECLRIRATGFESLQVRPLASTGWADLPPIASGSGTTSNTWQSLSAEFKISTGTSDASTPVAGTAADMASVYVAFKAIAAVDTEDDLLADNVASASSVTQPVLQQVHGILANDVVSASSVTQPVARQNRIDALANDIVSASSLTRPSLAGVVGIPFRIFRGMHTITLGAYGTPGLYDASSLVIFAAFTVPPDDTRKGVIDTLVRALKSASLWTKFDTLYLEAAADSQAAKINWIAPGTYDLTEINAPAFVADRGFTGASTKYLDSGFNQATAPSRNFTLNDASLFAWSRTATSTGSTGIVGLATSTGAGESMIFTRNVSNAQGYINSSSSSTWANADGSGLFLVTRRASNSLEGYRNGTSLGTGTVTSATQISENLVFLKRGASAYWIGQVAAGGWGSQMSAADSTALYNALQAYMTSVGA